MIDTAAEDRAILADWGEPLTIGGIEGLGILSRQTQVILDDVVVYEGDSILASEELCNNLKRGDYLNLNGIDFLVIGDPFSSADGLLCRIPVSGDSPAVAATAEDLTFLRDWGQPAIVRGQTVEGVLSHQTRIVLAGGVIHHGDSLLTDAVAASGLRYGETVTIGATTYRVEHDPWIGADGVLCRVPLTALTDAPHPPVLWVGLTTATGDALTTAHGEQFAVLPEA